MALQRVVLCVLGIGLLLSGLAAAPAVTPAVTPAQVSPNVVVHIVYFYAADCSECQALYDEVLAPLQTRCGVNLELKLVEIGQSAGYEAFVATERALTGGVGRWDIPSVVMGDKVYIDADAIRANLEADVLCAVHGEQSIDWPAAPELLSLTGSAVTPGGDPFELGGGTGLCTEPSAEESGVCSAPAPLYALLFFGPDCAECERALYDLNYLKSQYPQLVVEQRDITAERPLARALGAHFGIDPALEGVAPAVIIGDRYLVGETLTPDMLAATVERLAPAGAPALWETLDVPQPLNSALFTGGAVVLVGLAVGLVLARRKRG